MDDRTQDLSHYRLDQAEETLKVAQNCLRDGYYKDAINRSYYAAFYAVKAVLALEKVDFKRHKEVIGHFNLHYVKEDLFPRDIGRDLGRLKQIREKSDYDDFFVASQKQAEEQVAFAKEIVS